MAKIEIDQKECLGCSFCSTCAPGVFEVDQSDYKCKIKTENKPQPAAEINLSDEQKKQVEEAARDCPVQAIKFSEQ